MAEPKIDSRLRIVPPGMGEKVDALALNGKLNTADKALAVAVVGTKESEKTAGVAEQIVKVMIVKEPKEPEKWTWTQIGKYALFATGIGALGYYGYTQLWDLAKEVPPVVRTVHNVVTKGIPAAVNGVKTGVKTSERFYHGLGSAVAGTREVLNKVGVPKFLKVPDATVPVAREDVVQLGTEFVNNGWIGGATAAANAVYLAPVWTASVLAFGKPGKVTGMTALGALTLETAVPGSLDKIATTGDKVITHIRETYHKNPTAAFAEVAVAIPVLLLAVKALRFAGRILPF